MTTTQTIVREHEADLVVQEAETVADGVVALTLADPTGAELPPWTPGAHIDFVLTDDLVRQYSLCSSPSKLDVWRVGVLRDPNSRGGSEKVHIALTAGSIIRVRGPRNHFPLVASDRYLFVAGGIGITPMLPMIAEAECCWLGLAAALWRPRTRVYGIPRRTRPVRRTGDDRSTGRGGHVGSRIRPRNATARHVDLLLRARRPPPRGGEVLREMAVGDTSHRTVRGQAAGTDYGSGFIVRAGLATFWSDRPGSARQVGTRSHPRGWRQRPGILSGRDMRHLRNRGHRRRCRSSRLRAQRGRARLERIHDGLRFALPLATIDPRSLELRRQAHEPASVKPRRSDRDPSTQLLVRGGDQHGRRSRTAGPPGARNRCRLVPHHRRNSGRARGPLRAPALSTEPRPS